MRRPARVHVQGAVVRLPGGGENRADNLEESHCDHHEGGRRSLETALHTQSLAAAVPDRRLLNGVGSPLLLE